MTTLWTAKLDRELTEAEEQQLMLLLPAERRERLLKMKHTEKRREPLCAYGLLCIAVAEQYPELEKLPEMEYGSSGKPIFAAYPEIHFNLSHTDGAVLVGLSDWPIGVDIEKIRTVSDTLKNRLGGDTPEAFFRGWTRREARAKRTGAPVTLRKESPLEPEEQIIYPTLFDGFTACVCGFDVLKAEIHEYDMDALLVRLAEV